MKRKIFLICVTLVGLLTILTVDGCRVNSPDKFENIILGTALQESSVPIFIAEYQQFFINNHLNVVIKFYDSGATATNSLANNEIKVSIASEYVLVNQALGKIPIQAICSMDEVDFVTIIARKDLGITSISDLTDKRIGVVRNTATEFFLGRFLTLHGINTSAIKLVNMDSNPHSVDALINGNVDAIISVSPYVEEAANKLGANGIVWPAQSGQFIYILSLCRTGWTAANPTIITKYLKAIDQAENFILQHPDKAQEIIKKRLNCTDDDIARIWSLNQYSIGLDQSLFAAMEDESRWMIANGLIDAKTVPNFNDYIFIDRLNSLKPEVVHIIR